MSTPGDFAFDYLDRLSDTRGLYEHANGTARREDHGYCTDDNARLLVVATREPDTGVPHRLGRLALGFVRDAQSADGKFHNRMNRAGEWVDQPTVEDWWGRSLYGLGTAASQHADPEVRSAALVVYEKSVKLRSAGPRTMAFAALGAAEVLAVRPDHKPSRSLLADAITVIGPIREGAWQWPEDRLRYANATLAEAVIAAGAALETPEIVERGLTMLGWLRALETQRGHLSVTGVRGRGPFDHGPQFDQQPIEVAAMADACWRAYSLTTDSTWARGVTMAARWFVGDNDSGAVMHDDVSGGAYDGLQRKGVNRNQGAESTLALISTMQRARSFAPLP